MKLEIEIAGHMRVVDFTPGETTMTVDGLAIPVEARLLRPGVLSLIVEGRAWRVVLEEDANEPAVLIVKSSSVEPPGMDHSVCQASLGKVAIPCWTRLALHWS